MRLKNGIYSPFGPKTTKKEIEKIATSFQPVWLEELELSLAMKQVTPEQYESIKAAIKAKSEGANIGIGHRRLVFEKKEQVQIQWTITFNVIDDIYNI